MRVIFMFFALVLCCSCQPENDLIGKWQLKEIDFSAHLATLEGSEKERFEGIIDRQSTMLEQTFYNFLKDGVLQVITPKKEGTGQIMQVEKWRLSKNQDTLTMVNAETEQFLVDKTNESRLVLSSLGVPKRKLILDKVN